MKSGYIAVTGAGGFIGTHLVNRIRAEPGSSSQAVPRKLFEDPDGLAATLSDAAAVVHLAGLNRADDQELLDTNVALTRALVEALRDRGDVHVVFASSTQRVRSNAYGSSKLRSEELLREWAGRIGGSLTVAVIPNVFGPGCRPHYNSVIATFAHELSRGGECRVQTDRELELIYIGDLIERILDWLKRPPAAVEERCPGPTHSISVSQALKMLQQLVEDDRLNLVPDFSDPLAARFFGTYQSFLPYSELRRSLELHEDDRGRLLEYVRMRSGGQVFFSTTLPGVVRGNHFHTRKLERFCVVVGKAVIRMRRVGDSQVTEFEMDGRAPEVVSIPLFHTHHIENVGDDILYTLFWSNEVFDPGDPDTFPEAV